MSIEDGADLNASPRVPVFVITGMLGSGKTTLLAKLLRDPRLGDSLVIVNEFAEVGLDHHLVEGSREDVILLANGCLCCRMQGDLVAALQGVARRIAAGGQGVGRVFVETTGVADPAGVLATLATDPLVVAYLDVGAVLCMIDALNWEQQAGESDAALRQIASADHLLITKTDMIHAGELQDVMDALGALTPAQMHRVGSGPLADGLFGIFADAGHGTQLCGVRRLPPGERRVVLRRADHLGGDTHHLHLSSLETVMLRRDWPVTAAGLRLWLDLLGNFHAGNLLRMKGILDVDGQPVLVNGVRQVIHQVARLARWPDADRTTRIVFIGHDLRHGALAAVNQALDCRELAASPTLEPARFRAMSWMFARMRG